MTKRDEILEQYEDVTFKFADGFDDTIIGVAYDKVSGVYRIVYSNSKCINILMTRDEMTHEEAVKFFDFNVSDAYVGEDTPVWVDDIF